MHQDVMAFRPTNRYNRCNNDTVEVPGGRPAPTSNETASSEIVNQLPTRTLEMGGRPALQSSVEGGMRACPSILMAFDSKAGRCRTRGMRYELTFGSFQVAPSVPPNRRR
jgi:hypothetical protein